MAKTPHGIGKGQTAGAKGIGSRGPLKTTVAPLNATSVGATTSALATAGGLPRIAFAPPAAAARVTEHIFAKAEAVGALDAPRASAKALGALEAPSATAKAVDLSPPIGDAEPAAGPGPKVD